MSDAGTLTGLLRDRAAADPSRRMVQSRSAFHGWSSLSLQELDEEADRIASGLLSLGVGHGEPVAFMLSNEAGREAVVAYCGIHRAGAVAVPINTRFVAREIAEALRHAGVATVLHETAFAGPVAEAVEALPYAARRVETAEQPRGAIAWGELLASPPRELPRVAPDDMADWLFTSGTTGRPKCVMLTHANCHFAADSLSRCFLLEAGDVQLTPSPFFTSSGTHTSFLSSLFGEATYVMSPSTRAEDLLALIEANDVTVVGAVPAIFSYICASDRVEEVDLSGVKLVYHGGAAVNAGLVRRIQGAFPAAEVINVYGQTESGNPGTVLRGEWSVEKAGSIGRGGMPDVDVRVLDVESGEVLEGPGVGEVCLRSPAVFQGYLNDPEETAKVLRDGWLLTGDLVEVDEDGFMTVVDRRKDMIIRGGLNIATIEIESAINEHDQVLESAVVAKPHEMLGEDLKAYVVVRDRDAVSVEELRAHCAERLADFKVPRDISFVDELPRNPTGKVLKRDLRDRATEEASRPAGSRSR